MGPPKSTVPPPDLPDAVRSRLVALGLPDGAKVRTPIDPIQSWLIRTVPELVDGFEFVSARLARIRVVARRIDRLVNEELARDAALERRTQLWSFGGGFQTRWFGLDFPRDRVVHHEAEERAVIHYKHEQLQAAPWATEWAAVEKHPGPVHRWATEPTEDGVLAVIEGVWQRASEEELRGLLERIRTTTVQARLILELPGVGVVAEGPWWPNKAIAELGFEVRGDFRSQGRGALITPAQSLIAPAVEPSRVVLLTAAR